MPIYKVDVYPVYKTQVTVMADSEEEAADKAKHNVHAFLISKGSRHSVGDMSIVYSGELRPSRPQPNCEC